MRATDRVEWRSTAKGMEIAGDLTPESTTEAVGASSTRERGVFGSHTSPSHRRVSAAPTRRRSAMVAAALVAFAFACSAEDSAVQGIGDSGEEVGGGDGGGIGGTDGVTVDAGGGGDSVITDTTETPDGTSDAGGACPGGPGCECKGNGECGSGLCTELWARAGQRCLQACAASDECEADWHCLAIPSAGGKSYCLAKAAALCVPCSSDEICKAVGMEQGVCLQTGAMGQVCGRTCAADGDCPAGYACAAGTTLGGASGSFCQPAQGATCTCPPLAIEKNISSSCAKSNSHGTCKGSRTCGADAFSACSAAEPAAETCNGKDDDCDGQTDEGGAGCDDGKPCTIDACTSGACANTTSSGPCEADGNPCSEDTCKDGVCQGGVVKTCNDGKPCTIDSCDAKTGQCASVGLPEGATCSDGSACTSGDACQGGDCKAKAVDCDDKNPCTNDVCDAQAGCSSSAVSGACEDGNGCTQGDTCVKGACQGGVATTCNDGNPCTTDSCDVATGKCAATSVQGPCDDGSLCTKDDACKDGACTGAALPCDDSNPCTTDSCDAKTGCGYEANKAPCDDANACTDFDLCAGGKCKGSAKVASDCDDDNLCTKDSCNPKTGCVQAPHEGPCDDGNSCTSGDSCKAGACQGGTTICACKSDEDCAAQNPTNACLGKLYCDKSSSAWLCKLNPATVVTCNSGGDSTCAQNLCDPKTAKCAVAAVSDGKSCDADGSVCTAGDACKEGACVAGTQVGCDDSNPCTQDSCDQAKGCQHLSQVGPCDADGDACTVGDACIDKVCTVGKKKSCDDGELCTIDSCDTQTGACKNQGEAMAGKPCDADGTVCTSTDVCLGGKCTAGTGLDCNDGNPCTDDACDPKAGCVQTANVKPCDADGDACTAGDACSAKVCVAGAKKVCDDGEQCTKDACDAKTGACAYSPILGCGGNCATDKDCNDSNPCTADACDANAGKCGYKVLTGACDDGSACTEKDACADGKCVGAKKNCDDSNKCTDDSCDAVAGCVQVANNGACDDGDACTASDGCAGGKCAGIAKKCDDGDDCTKDSCNPGDGTCNAKPIAGCGGYCVNASDCDDKNPCTDESCVSGKCSSATNTKVCDDTDACTTKDVCVSGTCTGVQTVCDDTNPCTTDACNKKTGACAFVALPEKATCDDDSACTLGDACAIVNAKIVCQGKTGSCDDGNSCTSDSCDKVLGKCIQSPLSGATCDDGQPCTFGEACANGACKASTADSVANLSGDGTAGLVDEAGAKARFNSPLDIVALPAGGFVVADTLTHTLRSVAADGKVTTLAGSGQPGLGDGKGVNALLNQPYGVGVDAKGVVYFAEVGNHTVRKVYAGVVTRLAGDGQAGYVEGEALKARFNAPIDVVARKGGALVVSDQNNNRLRIIAGGNVATLAGSVAGFADGAAAAARFNLPRGLAIHADGSIFIADMGNHRIRRLSPDNVVTTVAGSGVAGWLDGDAATARLNAPYSVAVDDSGAIWISDRNNHRIRRILGGSVSTVAGSGTAGFLDGAAMAARFNFPAGLAVEPSTGGIVVADSVNHRLRRLWAGGGVAWCSISKGCVRAGLPNPQGPCQVCDPNQSATDWTTLANSSACLDDDVCSAKEVCVDGSCKGSAKSCDDGDKCTNDACDNGSGGCIFTPIVGCGGNCAKVEDCDDKNPCTDDACSSGKCGNTANTKSCDDGDLCTWGDICAGGVCKSGKGTEVSTIAGVSQGSLDGPLAKALMNGPRAIVTGADGRLYVANGEEHRIRVIDLKAGTLAVFAGSGVAGMTDAKGETAQFNAPSDIELRPDGVLVVTDLSNHRLRLIDKDGNTSTWTGIGGGYADGAATVARFNNPYGASLIPGGGAYVADFSNNRIRRVAADGTVTTLAGSSIGYADGKGAAAQFRYPIDVATLAGGGVLVADYENHRIRRVSADGEVTTLAGSGIAGLVDGAAQNARFYYPWGIGVDSSGRVLVADRYNHRLRAISTAGSVSTFAGTVGGILDGEATTVARLNQPWRFEVSADGTVLVADWANHRIRRLKESGTTCNIGGVCIGDGLRNPAAICQACNFAANAKAWTTLADNAVCEDGAPCTQQDACASGKCVAGAAKACDDKISCTKDSCDAKTGGCLFEVIVGCGEYCETDPQCDDKNPCTTDTCAKNKCVWVGNSLPCNDGDSCTMGDACKGAKCQAGAAVWVELQAGIGQGETDGAANQARFNGPGGVTVLSSGVQVIADRGNHRLRLISADGIVSTWTGSVAGLIDGDTQSARFNQPADVDADSSDRVIVADLGNQRVRLVDGTSVSTAAGGTAGFLDGPAQQARFANPYGVAFSQGGVVYVADYSNHRIRKLDLVNSLVSTVAGNGSAGHTDGQGASAVLNGPIGLDVGPDGTVYFVEHGGNRLRKVSATGQVVTIAGDGGVGYLAGQGQKARFNRPWDVLWLPTGELLVADSDNQRVRRVDSNANVLDWAGGGVAGYVNGEGLSAHLYTPRSLASLPSGLVYIVDASNHRIRSAQATATPCKINGACWSHGWTKAGSSCQACLGDKDSGNFSALADGASCDDGKLCVEKDACKSGSCAGTPVGCDDQDDCTTDACDTGTSACTFTKIIGCKGWCDLASHCDDKNPCTTDACVNNACQHAPNSLPCDDGNVCTIGEICVNAACKPEAGTTIVGTLAGSTAGWTDAAGVNARFNAPIGIALDVTGTLWVADQTNHRVRQVDSDGKVTTIAGSGTAGFVDAAGAKAWFNTPSDVGVLSSGAVVVADRFNHRVRVVATDGVVTTLAGSSTPGAGDGKGGAAGLNQPIGLAVGAADTVYVADFANSRVRAIAADGTVTTLAGSSYGYKDGKGAVAQFQYPIGIAVDGAGTLYVTEWDGHRVRRVLPDGTVTTFAGLTAGFGDGAATDARFNRPWGIDVDGSGRVWVVELGNHRLRQIESGIVTTAAGSGAGYKDGNNSVALFNSPLGVLALANGDLIVSDTANHRLRTVRITSNACSIGGKCYSDGTVNPDKGCEICAGAKSGKSWQSSACK